MRHCKYVCIKTFFSGCLVCVQVRGVVVGHVFTLMLLKYYAPCLKCNEF